MLRKVKVEGWCINNFNFRIFDSFLLWVILGLEGLGPEGGCFLDLLDRFEGFRSNDGGGSFLLVGSLSLDWLGLKGLNLA